MVNVKSRVVGINTRWWQARIVLSFCKENAEWVSAAEAATVAASAARLRLSWSDDPPSLLLLPTAARPAPCAGVGSTEGPRTSAI
jgi:hypothetical protein